MKSQITTTILPNDALLVVMEIMDSTNELLSLLRLSENEKIEFATIKMGKRQKEWLAVRLLLQNLFSKKEVRLHHTKFGSPYLEGENTNISISHSGKYLVALLHPFLKVGVDVQLKKDNIKEGVLLFMSEKEQTESQHTEDPHYLQIYWGAKEALYKYNGGEISITKDIYIKPFKALNQGQLLGYIKEEEVKLAYFYLDDYLLVHTD